MLRLRPMKYPATWPKPNPRKPEELASRITEQQKQDLYERRITTRDLAKLLGVHENYLSFRFPHKVPLPDVKELQKARKEYKLAVARQVLEGKYTVSEASKVAFVSYNTMSRFVKKAKEQKC